VGLRQIRTEADTALYKVCRPVEKFDKKLHMLLDDMSETMYHHEGVGLAASQIGILRRVAVIDVGEGLVELINPEILLKEGEEGMMEGCLSFPGQPKYVVRPTHVVVKAQNRYGEWIELDTNDYFARAVMHETDHLDGKVYLMFASEPPEGYVENEEEDVEEE
jgi:peptide deformylase